MLILQKQKNPTVITDNNNNKNISPWKDQLLICQSLLDEQKESAESRQWHTGGTAFRRTHSSLLTRSTTTTQKKSNNRKRARCKEDGGSLSRIKTTKVHGDIQKRHLRNEKNKLKVGCSYSPRPQLLPSWNNCPFPSLLWSFQRPSHPRFSLKSAHFNM